MTGSAARIVRRVAFCDRLEQCTQTRKAIRVDEPGCDQHAQQEKISREQAIRFYTINNAWLTFQETKQGSLETGKLADITVLSHDIMTIPEDDILSTDVVYTIVGGKVVWSEQNEAVAV